MGLLPELRSAGLRLTARGEQLLVEPKTALTDELRAVIRQRKHELLRELAKEAEAPLADFRAALVMGRLHVCCNCSEFRFGADPAGLGHCRRFNVEAAPFVPFWCAGFEPSHRAVAPDYLPDPDGTRARAREYCK